MKTNLIVALGALLLVWTSANMHTASAQNSSSNQSGGKIWLSVMDKDSDGTVSKQEFLSYMDAQFEKVDSDHDGLLDAKELDQLRKNLAIATKTKP